MDDGIRASEATSTPTARRLAPMRIGDTVVYVEHGSGDPVVESDDSIKAVAFSPASAFDAASDALRECVRIVGERMEAVAEGARPNEVTVEFALSFEAKGKALIPVFVSAESGVETALRVSAVWRRS
jgi:Trypsin-co-occurring domain 1